MWSKGPRALAASESHVTLGKSPNVSRSFCPGVQWGDWPEVWKPKLNSCSNLLENPFAVLYTTLQFPAGAVSHLSAYWQEKEQRTGATNDCHLGLLIDEILSGRDLSLDLHLGCLALGPRLGCHIPAAQMTHYFSPRVTPLVCKDKGHSYFCRAWVGRSMRTPASLWAKLDGPEFSLLPALEWCWHSQGCKKNVIKIPSVPQKDGQGWRFSVPHSIFLGHPPLHPSSAKPSMTVHVHVKPRRTLESFQQTVEK